MLRLAGCATLLRRGAAPAFGATAAAILMAQASRGPLRCASSVAATAVAADVALPRKPALDPAEGIRSVVLYQYQTCPFCNKVRAYLDIMRIPYVVVEVDPLLKGQLAWSTYKKVPVVVVNGVQLNDSSAIIDELDAVVRAGRGTSASAGAAAGAGVARLAGVAAPVVAGDEREAEWRRWVNDTLVQALTVNIYRSPGEAWRTFDYLTERNFPLWSALPAKALGSSVMYLVAGKRKKTRGWTDERKALYDTCNAWADAVGTAPFLGGVTPNAADVEAFGAMRSIHGLDTWRDMLAEGNTRLAGWYRRMEAAVGPSQIMHRIGEAPGAASSFA